ncbi:alpha/beta fold hydrolase [Microbacterium sp.]|uniref:alpha/beta fold hydrolase n=1 Tax=Microbacterium sp. TaxID=51671 RepID=UPI0039E6B50E
MQVLSDNTEFRYLPAQADAIGVPLPPVERLAIELPDGRILSALRFGDGAPEITLLHGAGLNAHTWDTTALALQHPLLAVDLAGHGDSSWRDDADYGARTLAADLIPALEAWTARPQLVVGQSLGGLTAAALAAARPDLVAGVVIVDITPGVDVSAGPAALRAFYEGPTDFATREELVDRAIAAGLGGSRAETERGVFLNTRERPDGRIEWKHHFAHLAAQALAAPAPDPGAAPASAPGAAPPASAPLLRDDGWEDLAATVAPITLVRATKGFVTAADAAAFARRVPDAAIVEIDATHNVQETAPVQLARLIGGAL